MDKFKTALNIANKQANLGVACVALLTAGGEQVFSTAVFQCPCNNLNFIYGMVFLLVPALALLLLGYILSKKTWKLMTGACQRRDPPSGWRRLSAAATVFFQISVTALVAPSSWIAVGLLSGNYYECAMTGFNVSLFSQHLCTNRLPDPEQCRRELHKFPCGKGTDVPQATREDLLHTLRAESQILGWLLIAFIMLSNLLLTCVARCTSPISYLQLKFWSAYAREESSMFDTYAAKHAKDLAERNLKSFFNKTPPENIITPSKKGWEKISSLYKFSTKDQFYSTLHRFVENNKDTDHEMTRMMSIKSSEDSGDHPRVLDFVDEGGLTL